MRDRDQWLRRPLPIGDEGKRIHCSVHYGADEYVYQGETFKGARLDAFCGGISMVCARLSSPKTRRLTSTPFWAAWSFMSHPQ